MNDPSGVGLGGGAAAASKPFTVQPLTTELRPGIDPRGFNKLYDDLETEEFLKNRNTKG